MSLAVKFTKGRFKVASYRPRVHSDVVQIFSCLWFMICVYHIAFFCLSWNLSFGGIVGYVFGFGGKTWVSLYLSLIFSPTLDRPKKFEWYIYQLFLSLLLWVLGHESHSPHARTRAEPGRAGFGSGWRAPTTCGHECNFVQGVLGPAAFWKLFFCHFNNCFCESRVILWQPSAGLRTERSWNGWFLHVDISVSYQSLQTSSWVVLYRGNN